MESDFQPATGAFLDFLDEHPNVLGMEVAVGIAARHDPFLGSGRQRGEHAGEHERSNCQQPAAHWGCYFFLFGLRHLSAYSIEVGGAWSDGR